MVGQTDPETGRTYVTIIAEDEARLWSQFAAAALTNRSISVGGCCELADRVLEEFRKRFCKPKGPTLEQFLGETGLNIAAGGLPSNPNVGIDLKYGKVLTERGKFHPNEPVFVLRAQDPLADVTIADYNRRCRILGCTYEHIGGVSMAWKIFHDWKTNNSNLMKKHPGD